MPHTTDLGEAIFETADHRVGTDVATTYDRGIGADRRAPTDDRRNDRPVFAVGPREKIIGEDRARPDEDVVVQRDAGIEGHVVLHLDARTHAYPDIDEH